MRPWRIGQSSPVLISTSTLAERERPYLLEVELARGMLNNLRNQLAQWESMGLVITKGLTDGVLESTSEFSRAATTQYDVATAADWANRSLATTITTMARLADEYVRQATAAPPRPAAANELLVRREPGWPAAPGQCRAARHQHF